MLIFPQRHLLRTILQARQNTTKPWRAIKQIEPLRVINLVPFFYVNKITAESMGAGTIISLGT